MIGKLICKLKGHKWMTERHYEHICVTDMCWRCGEKRVIHLWGSWGHTCEELKGQRDSELEGI